MEILKQLPLPQQIEAVLAADYAPVDFFQLVTILLKHTVPEVYSNLPETTQNAITKVFRTLVGLGNLISRIEMLSSLKADVLRDLVVLLNAYIGLLQRVLAPKLVLNMLEGASALALREADKLLFKGKCFSVIRAVEMRFNNVSIPVVLKSIDAYSTFLSKELLYVDSRARILFTFSILSLGDLLYLSLFDVMFQRSHIECLDMRGMKRFEQKQMLVRFLDFCSRRYLQPGCSTDVVAALYVLCSRSMHVGNIWDEILLDKVVARYSFPLSLLAALLATNQMREAETEAFVIKAVTVWGNSSLLNVEPIVRQGHRTHLLLCLCAQLPPHALQRVMKLTAFVNAISNRLLSLSTRVKSLGIFLADSVSTMAHADRIFDMDTEVDLPVDCLSRSDILFNEDDSWDILESPQVIIEEPSQQVEELEKQLQPINIDEGDRVVEDGSDDEDDPTLATNSKPVARPIYVRDVLSYLSVDTKAPQAYEKQRIALKTIPTLLRQKLAFGTEVSFYAEDLFTQLAALTNHYEEADFDTLKLNAMIAVVASYPDITAHLCRLLLNGDYSLQQRMCLLSALSLGARELRGYVDEVVAGSFQKSQFPTKLLPEKLHRQYLAAAGETDTYDKIEHSIQNQLMHQDAEDARDELAGGKILRVSAGLKKSTTVTTVQGDANFSKIVGRKFFFPLVAVWYESGGINVGHYTPILVAHFLRTLSIVLHCAYPAAVELNEMAGEYLTLLCPVLQKVTPDQLQVIGSIVTGIMLVTEILDDVYMVTHFGHVLALVESTIGSFWDQLIDDTVKSLCAGLLLRMAKLRESMERVLVDQNAMY